MVVIHLFAAAAREIREAPVPFWCGDDELPAAVRNLGCLRGRVANGATQPAFPRPCFGSMSSRRWHWVFSGTGVAFQSPLESKGIRGGFVSGFGLGRERLFRGWRSAITKLDSKVRSLGTPGLAVSAGEAGFFDNGDCGAWRLLQENDHPVGRVRPVEPLVGDFLRCVSIRCGRAPGGYRLPGLGYKRGLGLHLTVDAAALFRILPK